MLEYPILSTNGSSKKALAEDLENASHKLYQALEAMRAIGPHPRDYQSKPDPTASFNKANAQHIIRVMKVQEVLNEITTITFCLQSQLNARNKPKRK